MDHKDITIFLELVRCRNISKTAENLYLSQSAVSSRLKALEAEMGCQLVLRFKGQRSVELTRQGEEFISVAERWKLLLEETEAVKKGAFCRSHRHQRKHLRPSAGRVLAAIHRTASGKEDTDKGVRLQRHV